MTINKETLKRLREEMGFSQEELSEVSNVSQRQISRIESGKTDPSKVRQHTLESLAKALKVDPKKLSKAQEEWTDAEWEDRGYVPIKTFIKRSLLTNFKLVDHHYSVSFYDLIEAAPWMFALLAEMSLASRRRKLADAESAFAAAMACMPKHLHHGEMAGVDADNAFRGERSSLASRDVFGRVALEENEWSWKVHWPEPFDPDETNPFVDFLQEMATSTGSDALRPGRCELRFGNMPEWPLFETWIEQVTGGDRWAKFALENVKVGLSEMPDDLKGDENTEARVEWIVSKIPSDVREKEEQRIEAEEQRIAQKNAEMLESFRGIKI